MYPPKKIPKKWGGEVYDFLNVHNIHFGIVSYKGPKEVEDGIHRNLCLNDISHQGADQVPDLMKVFWQPVCAAGIPTGDVSFLHKW